MSEQEVFDLYLFCHYKGISGKQNSEEREFRNHSKGYR